MLKVNGKMLTWAREDCGLSLEDAALKLGYKDSKQSSALKNYFTSRKLEKYLNPHLLKHKQLTVSLY